MGYEMMAANLTVILALALGTLLCPMAADGQQPEKVHRIGLFDYGAPEDRPGFWNAFHQQMRELGYVEGQNIRFERHWGKGDNDRLSQLAAELVALKVDVIVTGDSNATLAAKRATSTIPIVTASGSDPVALELAASLRQPGGNVTGMTSVSSELAGKRLELLRIMAPHVSRVAILWDERTPGNRLAVQESQVAARTLGLTLKSISVRTPADFEAAFAALVADRAAAVSITTSTLFVPHRKRLAELAMKHRLPTISGDDRAADAGLLATYGVDYTNLSRRAATFVDKILKGAKPGDLPIERPTRFELVINLKTAEALGLTLPPSFLQRVDRVIQ